MNYIKYGFLFFRIYSLAYFVAERHARVSFPSTLVLAIPNEIALGMMPSDAY